MSIFDIFRRKSAQGKPKRVETTESIKSNDSLQSNSQSLLSNHPLGKPANNMFSKEELKTIIETIANISYIFRDSQLLASTGGNMNLTMMRKLIHM